MNAAADKQNSKQQPMMPQFLGLSVNRALKLASLKGISVEHYSFGDSELPEGQVIGQYPHPGPIEGVSRGVRLTIAGKSWIEWLPYIYQQEDSRQGNFLRNFLWLFKHPTLDVSDIIENVHSYFDPFETPKEFLPWLESILAFTLDESWEESKKRLLISRIVTLYKLRGTVRGLKLFLKIYTNEEPDILENYWPFNGLQVGCTSTVGVDTIIIGRIDRAHCFTVRIPIPLEDMPDSKIRQIHAILLEEKPAHTNYFVIFAEREVEEAQFMQVGIASMVGIESRVGKEKKSQSEIQEGHV